jgi:hypothetical protein
MFLEGQIDFNTRLVWSLKYNASMPETVGRIPIGRNQCVWPGVRNRLRKPRPASGKVMS